MINKKAQEEMVGFILIIILVAVIGLFFMFMMSKQAKPFVKSNEVESFLYSSLLYTTSCYPEQNANPYNLQYLAEACSNSKTCYNGEEACKVLEQEISDLLNSAFIVEEGSRYKAYKFNIYSYSDPLLELKKGNLTANLYGASVTFYPSMNMSLRLYL